MARESLIGTPQVLEQLRRLGVESERTIRDGLARLAFEVRDALVAEVAGALDWSGPSTQKFISGGFRVRYQTTDSGLFTAIIYPLPRSLALISRHVAPFTNLPDQHADLQVRGKLAIPIPGIVPRTRSGKVPGNLLPAALLRRDGTGRSRGFINQSGTAILYRLANGDVQPAYALRDSTTQPKRIDLVETARRAAEARASTAFAAAIARARKNAGV